MRAGVLSRVQAAASPMRNIITRAIGTQPTVEPEIALHAAQPGDLYLLASDGLSRELDEGRSHRFSPAPLDRERLLLAAATPLPQTLLRNPRLIAPAER